MPTRVDEPSISKLLAQGELRAAAEQLVVVYGADVLGLCTSMVSDRSAAEDLAQEAFSRAFTALDGFRGDSSPRTWLLAIARNVCFDHLRRRQRTPSWVDGDFEAETYPDDAPLPSELLSNHDSVSRALEGLDEPERSLVMLRFCHGLDYDEIAQVFGIKPGTARMRLCRVLAKMRSELAAAESAPATPSALIEVEMESYLASEPMTDEDASETFRRHRSRGAVQARPPASRPTPDARVLVGGPASRPTALSAPHVPNFAKRVTAILRRVRFGGPSPGAPTDEFAQALAAATPAFPSTGLLRQLLHAVDRL